ncbi:UbiA prenyltransferase family-domain-containing protein [Podospora australis]|uniref:Protoheme IX farnesyltransferase, mitochondrial n=1 Tax=Podospora australis TaxID=1536484 RepID=A0AAN6WU18_9PEZI|nr:UbiA prenyltransferase family-domain-containing protein [Podospora australis]
MRPPISGLRLRPSVLEHACWQCTTRALLKAEQRSVGGAGSSASAARFFTKSTLSRTSAAASPITGPAVAVAALPRQRFKAGYFVSNNLLARFNGTHVASSTENAPASVSASAATAAPDITAPNPTLLPHRARQAARRNAAAAAATNGSATPIAAAASGISTETDAPTSTMAPDASSQLAAAAARHPADSLRRKFSSFLSLSKPRLTVLVVLSAMVPYALYPVPAFLSSAATVTPSLSPLTLLFLTTGTTLCSAAANALNMLYEPDTDAKMSRTRTRPLVRRLLSTKAAVFFAIGCGMVGTGALFWGVNPTVAFLGASNIVIYAGMYTPLKRLSAINTWVGAIVGGIPPLMGWAAAAGESATADGTWRELLFAGDGSSLGGWLFAAILFAWQFPHFMPLSWGIREEYKAAGLRMLAWTNPARNARVALRYSLVFIPLCLGLCAAGVTEWSFAVTSAPVNVWLIAEAVKFWRHEGHKGSARGLFWASVWHLPVVMVLALAQKKGMWSRVWRSVAGEPDEDDDEYFDDEEDEGAAV